MGWGGGVGGWGRGEGGGEGGGQLQLGVPDGKVECLSGGQF